MAASNKVEIEITAIDRASAVFRSASSSVRSFAINANNGMIRANNALRSYNNTMMGFNSAVQRALWDAGRAIYNFTEDAIKQFAELEKQHAKTMGAMASNYDFNWAGYNTPTQVANKNRFYADSNALMQQAYVLGSRGPTGTGSLYSPTEIAAAQTALVKAGVDPKDIINTNALTDVIKFAGGNDLSIDEAVEFAVQLGTQFKINPVDWGGMLDQVTYAANASVIDVEDIIASMKYAGNLSSGFDQPLSDVLAALAIMGNSGLKGSQAGTGIAAIFTRSMSPTGITGAGTPPTENVEEIYNQFKDKVTDENGMFLGLGNFTDQLTEIYATLTDEELAWFNKKLFGMFQMKAAMALGRTGEDGEQVFDEMADSIVNYSPGTNDTIYDIMIGSSGGQLEAVNNAYIAFKQQFGEGLSPITKEVARQMINALSTGDFTFDFDAMRVAIDEAKALIDEKMGEGVANAVGDVGNFILDTAQVGGASFPLLTGTADAVLKLFNGDIDGAIQTFSDHLDDVNGNIEELPTELQDTATGFRNLILVLEGLFALNVVTRISEMLTSIGRLFVGNKIRANITSASTKVTSAKSTINVVGQTNAIVQYLLAKTNVMYVQAGTVFVNGGSGTGFNGGGGSPMLGGGGSPLLLPGGGGNVLGLPGSVLTGVNFGIGLNLGSQILRNGMQSLGSGAAGAAGAIGSGSLTALPAAGAAGATGAGAAAGGMSASAIAATAAKALGVVGLVVGTANLLTTSAGINNSPAYMEEIYQQAYGEGYRGVDEIAKRMTEIDGALIEGGEMPNGEWFYPEDMANFIQNYSSFVTSSDGMQKFYDALTEQILSGGKIDEKFLSGFMSENGIDYGYGQVILEQLLNNMFGGGYTTPKHYFGDYADSSVNKYVKEHINNPVDWSQYATQDQILSAINNSATNMTTASISLSDAVKQLLDNDRINILGLGQGPLSDEGAYNYIMGQLGSGGGIAANNELLQQIVGQFAAFDPTTEINLQNPAPIVNVDVDVSVDKNGNVSKNIIKSFSGINDWLFASSKRFGTTSN